MHSSDDQNVPPGRVPPIDEDELVGRTRDSRRVSGDRQRGIELPANQSNDASRKYSPAQIDRRKRSLTLTFPSHELLKELKRQADLLSERIDQAVSPTRLATLLVVHAFEQYLDGQLELTFVDERVEKLAIRPKDDD